MILPFSTQLNGKPTKFVEKILIGIDKHLGIYHTEPFLLEYKKRFDINTSVNINSKIHTIREDKKDRWQVGKLIHFYINNRTKNAFQFAPVLPVVSVQKIEIIHTEYLNDLIINIDGKKLNESEMQQLAYNDGFDNLYKFIAYFNEDFTGKIIHWTEKRY